MYSTQMKEFTSESSVLVDSGKGRLIDLEGQNLYLCERGNGAHTVLVHGFPDHSENFERLFHGLSKEQHVYAYDQFGQGRSDKPQKNYGIKESVDDLVKLQDNLNLGPMILVGHSIGGTIGTAFSAKYPERVKALVLLNPAFKDFHIQTGMDYLGAWFMRLPIVGETMLLFHMRMATKQCLKLAFYDRSKITEEMVDRYHFPFKVNGGKKSYLKIMRSIYYMNEEEYLRTICQVKAHGIPVFLVWTEKDWSMPIEDGHFFSGQLGATLHTIPECGHSPHLELEDDRLQKELIEPIQRFLSNL